MRALVAKI